MSSAPDPRRRGLGRGLEVLLGGEPSSRLAHLPPDSIHPNPRQPRRRHDPEAATGLANSIRAQGMLQPVVVRPRAGGGYELIAGERRWRAARAAGVDAIPAVLREADDRDTLLLGLVENVAREQLSAADEVIRHFGALVFRTAVPRSVRLAEAPSHGLPGIVHDPRSAGADAYWKVAMELVERR